MSLRTWLYRIATNVCLDTLNVRNRRARPTEESPAGSVEDALIERPRTHWLEPISDSLAIPSTGDPAHLAILRQSIRLAFVAALQLLPPKQRAVLLLVDILGWAASEVAESFDTSVAGVNSALQRARSTLSTRTATPEVLPEEKEAMLNKYVEAFERYDVEKLTSLLHEDATFSMPPYSLWLQGHEPIKHWLLGRGVGCRGSRLITTQSNGAPAFGQYHPSPEGGFSPWALIVLELKGNRIAAWNSFLDTATLFPRFELPPHLPA